MPDPAQREPRNRPLREAHRFVSSLGDTDKKDHKHMVSLVMSPAVLRFYFVVMEVEALQLEYRSPARAVAACPGSTVDACK